MFPPENSAAVQDGTWTPYAAGSLPPAGSWVETLHPDGGTTPLVYCHAPNWLRLPPLFGTFDRPVIGWRPATGPFPRVPKAAAVTNSKCW